MPPKKAAATSEEGVSDELKKYAAHPPTMVMVKEALAELNSKKGSSTQAIRNYVTEKYPSIDSVRLKYLVRKAVVKGVERGEFVRPAKSTFSGAQGTFRLAVKSKAKGLKTASENSDPNVKMAAEPGIKKTKTKKIKDAEKEPVQKRKDPKPKVASKVAPQASGDESDGEEEPKRKTSKAAKGTKKEPVKKEKLPTEDSKSKKAPKAGATASKVAPAKKPKAKKSPEGEVGMELQKKPRAQRASKAAKDKVAEPKEATKVAEPKEATKVAEPKKAAKVAELKAAKVAKKLEVEEEAASTQAAPGRRGKGVKN